MTTISLTVNQKKKRKAPEATLLECIICHLPSKNIMIQNCGHAMCLHCKWQDLNSGRGFVDLSETTLTNEEKQFRTTQALWQIQSFKVFSERKKLKVKVTLDEKIPLIGCPICKDSCYFNQMNVFSFLTIDYFWPPMLNQTTTAPSIKTCWHCQMNFPPSATVKFIHDHLLGDCTNLSFQCPLNDKCRIQSFIVKEWITRARTDLVSSLETVTLSKKKLIENLMIDLLETHLGECCLVNIKCDFCNDVFSGTMTMGSHFKSQDCESLHRLNQVSDWIKTGHLAKFNVASMVAELYRESRKYLITQNLFEPEEV